MIAPYTKYGVPDQFEGKYYEIPNYAIKIKVHETGNLIDVSSGLSISQVRLWGQIDNWTALEAALLLAGGAPDDPELYGVIKMELLLTRESKELLQNGAFQFLPIHGFWNYCWKYAKIFNGARDYLFLFDRSELAPKSPPIEWVKYFNKKVRNSPIKNPFEHQYCDNWLDFFNAELSETNQAENLIPSLQKNSSRREQQIEMILFIIAE